MHSDKDSERYGGYLAAATWLARDTDNETLIFRKFDTLSAANLLYMQSEILGLEKSLDNMHLTTIQSDDMDLKDAASTWETLVEQSRTGATSFRQDAKERMELIKELREKLREYRNDKSLYTCRLDVGDCELLTFPSQMKCSCCKVRSRS